MKKKIINNRTGASLITIILAISLVSALAMFVSSQVINQIKSTSKRTNEIQLQYTSESGIERTIEELLDKVKSSETAYSVSFSKLRSGQSSYLDLIQQEIEGIKEIDSVNTYELKRAINDIDYSSDIDSIILKLSNVRTELLNIVKYNSSQRKQIKDIVDVNISKVCKAIDYANAEKNKNIEPIEFKGGSNPRDFQDYNEALNKIIGNDKNAYGNTYDLIVSYMASAWSKIDNIHSSGQSNSTNLHLEETKKLVSLAQGMHLSANSYLKNKLSQYSSKFNVWNPNQETQERILKEVKESLIEIDSIIDTYLSDIRNMRREIYQTYTYCMANYTLYKEEEFKTYTDEALKMYDSLEDQLRWFKKKINLFDSNTDDSTDSPDTEVPDDSNTPDVNIDDIKLIGYTDEFEVMNSLYTYEVKYETADGILADEIILPIKTQNLKKYNLNIVSIATNNKKTYKTKATIMLNLENGIQYSVETYERIN